MITVNGKPLTLYLRREEKVNPDLLDKKSKEIQKFLQFELMAMRRPGLHLQKGATAYAL